VRVEGLLALTAFCRAGSLDQPDVGEMNVEFYTKDRVSYQQPQAGAQQLAAFG